MTIDEKTMKDFHRFCIVLDFSTIFRSWKCDLSIDEETMKDLIVYSSLVILALFPGFGSVSDAQTMKQMATSIQSSSFIAFTSFFNSLVF